MTRRLISPHLIRLVSGTQTIDAKEVLLGEELVDLFLCCIEGQITDIQSSRILQGVFFLLGLILLSLVRLIMAVSALFVLWKG